MKCILLAAGYATRLYPLTKDRPKSLLPIGESTILEFIIKKVERVDVIDSIIIITNAKFYEQFRVWTSQYQSSKEIIVFNDGSTTNDNRLGAIADLQMAIDQAMIDEDVLVLAGDNLFDFALEEFIAFYKKVSHDCIMAHELTDKIALQRTGVITIDKQQCVTSFEEKPQQPKSNLAVPPFYIYKRETLPLIRQYLDQGNNPDAPGHFIPWLLSRKSVSAFLFNDRRYDIGTLESYNQACEIFSSSRMA